MSFDIDFAIQLALEEKTSPLRLYHGSFYHANILRPGYEYTGIEVTWDQTENNRWLYATADRTLAIEMGFASALSQVGVNVDHFATEPGRMQVWSQPIVDDAILKKIARLYLYTLKAEGFQEVHNQHNNATNEYKRQDAVVPLSVEEICLESFLKGYDVKFRAS